VLLRVSFRDQRLDRATRQLLAGVAKQVFALRVREHDHTIPVDRDDRVRGALKQLLKTSA